MQNKFESLTPAQIDAMREIGNIGAGNAATALSGILGKTVEMTVPEIRVIPLSGVQDILGSPENPVVGGMVDLTGDMTGQVMLILGIREAYTVASLLCGRSEQNDSVGISDLTELDISALEEVTNILCGSYLSAISSLSGLNTTPSVPYMCIDMAGAMLSIIAVECGKTNDCALFFETCFSEAEDAMACHFFLLPDRESYKRLMASLGVS